MLFRRVLKHIHFLNRKASTLKPLTLNDFGVDFSQLQNAKVLESVENNIRHRKGVGDIRNILHLKQLVDSEPNLQKKIELERALVAEVQKLPNSSHSVLESYGQSPHVVRPAVRAPHTFPLKPFSLLAKDLKILTGGMPSLTGPKSYYLIDKLADLEHALVRYFVSSLVNNHNFTLVSVPDILPEEVVERCGMTVRGERSQVYKLDRKRWPDPLCLSGTAEMSLAGMLASRSFTPEELPIRLVAVSRCFREETSNLADEKGIYRVHQFTKVEMFGVSGPNASDDFLAELLSIQQSHFEQLGLDFQVLDMPLHELGAPAYRKHDIEAWFPARKKFGELSSCSNCTDYQARRLHMRLVTPEGSDNHVHTVNGTACAVPRTLMALVETHQQPDGTVLVPPVLIPYMQTPTLF